MIRRFPAIVATLAVACGYAWASHKPEEHPPTTAAVPVDAPIVVTINPEGRVSVKLGGDIPPRERAGTTVDWAVRVVNQGYSTGRLVAQLVGEPAPLAILGFTPDRLKGSPREMRVLRITLTNAAPTDLTIAFRLANETSDLGGRNQIHVLIHPL